MVQTIEPSFWNDLSKKGKQDGKIKEQLTTLLENFDNRTSEKVFSDNISNDFTKEFQKEIDIELNKISPSLSKGKRDGFNSNLATRLDILLRKKGFCEINLDSYPLHKFIESFASFIDEVTFKIKEEGIFLEAMDPSRICLVQMVIKHESYKFYREGKSSINIGDLTLILKCQTSDNSNTTLIFGENKVFANIHSTKFGADLPRTLSNIDLDQEDVPLDNLSQIQYPIKFSISKPRLEFTLKNLSIYSEITEIQAFKDKVIFQECGQIGEGSVIWKDSMLKDLVMLKDVLTKDSEDMEIKESIREISKEILKGNSCNSAHSLTFLRVIGKMMIVIDKKDYVNFSMKTDHPIKISIDFPKLGDTRITYFLAPRVPELDFDDEDLEP